jgi:hypothetical protein
MSKFKVGDKIVSTKKDRSFCEEGQVFILKNIDEDEQVLHGKCVETGNHVACYDDEAISFEIYNSPLYQALK